jgi:dipeptidase E
LKLLLTSAGIKNPSIHDALVELLGKPTAECDALCIPTALYGHPMAGPRQAWRCISGQETGTPTVGLGWKSMGVLELTALPSIKEEHWVPLLRETDVLLVEGGDATYLCHWMRASGLADLLPSLPETVWVGVSAGSMVMTPRIGDDFVMWPSAVDDRTLGIVDFSIFPHLDNPDLPWNTMATAEEWAAGLSGPAYAIDDETAFKVVDGTVEVVSEGHWKLLTPQDRDLRERVDARAPRSHQGSHGGAQRDTTRRPPTSQSRCRSSGRRSGAARSRRPPRRGRPD